MVAEWIKVAIGLVVQLVAIAEANRGFQLVDRALILLRSRPTLKRWSATGISGGLKQWNSIAYGRERGREGAEASEREVKP